ncbi:heme oxygenase, partial [Bacillus thuringiensis]|nr:heme oxygenase [Bacillus thuringiensis]
VKCIVSDTLLRTGAFEQDLNYHLGTNWRDLIQPSPLAVAYCNRINKVANTDPTLLLAYTHSLYLVLLDDGDVIQQIIQGALGLP